MLQHPAPMRATRAAMFAAVCTALGAVGHAAMSGTDIPFARLAGAFLVTAGLAWAAAGRRRGPAGIAAAVLTVQGVLHLVFSGSRTAGPAPGATHHPHHHMPGPNPDPGATAAGTPGVTTGPARSADAAAMADTPPTAGMAGHDMPPTAGMTGHDTASTVGTAGHDTVGTGVMAGHDTAGFDIAGFDIAGSDLAGHAGLGMIAAHVLAGLACAAWLAWGEAAVFRLGRALGAAALHAARPLSRVLDLLRARVAAPPAPPSSVPPYERPRGLRGAVHAYAVVRRGPPVGRSPHATAPGRPARV